MSKALQYFKHVLISLMALVCFLGILFLSRGAVADFVFNPQNHFNGDLSGQDISLAFIYFSLIVISVLVSYVIYLLLGYDTRFHMQITSATRSVALGAEQFRLLYDSAPVPYIMLNKEGEIFDPNKSALRFFGVMPEEIDGKNIFSYLAGEHQQEAEKYLQYYKTGIPFNRKEVAMITKKGETRLVEMSIFEMPNLVSGEATGLTMIFDVTEQKLLDKAKTEFVSLASHQLRQPLATTKWFTEMLASPQLGELNPKQLDYIAKLHTANQEMVDLVDVLLNVSRIEMGTLPIETKETNVEALSESILLELSSQINTKKLNIVKEYNGKLQNIKSDPKLLRIVVQNLISNAVKYTPDEGTVVITFEETGTSRKIVVSDNGVGIPKEAQERIFTKLYRADNVRTLSNVSGTGLGLYLVKSIIESIGGSISFVSEENKGSVFTIKL